MVLYLHDSYRSFKNQVSILRYEKGDPWLMNYAPVGDTQLSARSLGWDFELSSFGMRIQPVDATH